MRQYKIVFDFLVTRNSFIALFEVHLFSQRFCPAVVCTLRMARMLYNLFILKICIIWLHVPVILAAALVVTRQLLCYLHASST